MKQLVHISEMIATWSLLWFATVYKVIGAVDVYEDNRRPIWNVAHMVNALYQVDYYLDQGANSLEFDISFDWEGVAKFTYHGIPCDCFRSCLRYEHFIPYLNYMRMLTTPGLPQYREELVLLMMDLKVHGLSPQAKKRAGEDIATKLLDHYWKRGASNARANIVLSIPSINHMDFLDSFRYKMKEENFTHYLTKIGFDFSGNENLEDIRLACKKVDIEDRIWQGDGITNCLPRGTSRLREALWRRDQPGRTYVDKVYWWTVDKMSTMRTVLRMGIDAMITNYPDRLISVLDEEEFSGNFRLATFEDNPWAKYKQRHEKLISGLVQGRDGSFGDYMTDELLYNC